MMNKIYTNPEIEIILFDGNDIMTASTTTFDPENILGGDATSWWDD